MRTITHKDRHYYDLAMKVARLSNCGQMHGAVIVCSGRVLSVASNNLRTHPVSNEWTNRQPPYLSTIHAEQRAIILARTDIRGATLYSARINGGRMSKPCKMCTSLMYDAGIRYVVYYHDMLVKIRL